MKRDELLTELAMQLAEWPAEMTMPVPHIRGAWTNHGEWKCYAKGDNRAITRGDYLAERERLINKPSWDDAPGWANYLCQQQAGAWCWYAYEPSLELNKWAGGASNRSLIGNCGQLPAGHDWRDTLERRPAEWPSEERIDAIGQNGPSGEHYEDDEFRQRERRLREAELLRHITPAELVNRQLVQRCDELQEDNARLADENQRLRRTIGELCA